MIYRTKRILILSAQILLGFGVMFFILHMVDKARPMTGIIIEAAAISLICNIITEIVYRRARRRDRPKYKEDSTDRTNN